MHCCSVRDIPEAWASSSGECRRWLSGVALLAGSVTAFCGPIPFLGLVAAHVSRGVLNSSDHLSLLPAAALVGATLGLTTDLLTHLPWSKHFLHLDAVIGMIGGPVALWIVLRWHNARALEL
jgi:iron complex transport system permease protein